MHTGDVGCGIAARWFTKEGRSGAWVTWDCAVDFWFTACRADARHDCMVRNDAAVRWLTYNPHPGIPKHAEIRLCENITPCVCCGVFGLHLMIAGRLVQMTVLRVEVDKASCNWLTCVSFVCTGGKLSLSLSLSRLLRLFGVQFRLLL